MLFIDGYQVGHLASAEKPITLQSAVPWPAGLPTTSSPDGNTQERLQLREAVTAALTTTSLWRSPGAWLLGRSSTVECEALWPESGWSHHASAVEAALQSWRLHSDNFVNPTNGIAIAADQDGGLTLVLPRDAAALGELKERLKERLLLDPAHTTTTHAKPADAGDSAALMMIDAVLEPGTLFAGLCLTLAVTQRSVAPLALAASTQCAAGLLGVLVDCDKRWGETQQRFAAWQEAVKGRAVSLDELPHLFSRDGPWRGNYEDACFFTKARAARASTHARALAVALCSVWHAYLGYAHKGATEPAMVLCAGITWMSAACLLFHAAVLTERMQNQSLNLYELHRVAVQSLTGELQATGDNVTLQRVQSQFELEYGLITEYMRLNAAGFTLLETKVTWSMAVTMTTVLLPSMARHLLTGQDGALWSSWGWLATGSVMVVAALVCLADSAKCVAVSRGYAAVMARWQKHAANGALVLHKQKALLIVIAVLLVHTMQHSSPFFGKAHKDEL